MGVGLGAQRVQQLGADQGVFVPNPLAARAGLAVGAAGMQAADRPEEKVKALHGCTIAVMPSAPAL